MVDEAHQQLRRLHSVLLVVAEQQDLVCWQTELASLRAPPAKHFVVLRQSQSVQTATRHLLHPHVPKEAHPLGRVTVLAVILTRLEARAPTEDLLVFVQGHRVLVSRRQLHNALETRNQLGLAHEVGSLGPKTELATLVVAPRIDCPVDRDGEGVRVAATDLLDELVLEDREHARVEDLLRDGLLGEVSEGVVAELAMSVRAPRVEDSVHITFVDAAVLRVDDR